jgi:prolyl-tRNA editing enzyme YbaK/EbsC (Cys-tRNA(Pro) deacylase)
MKADDKLDKLGVHYEEVVQDNQTKSCDDAAQERGVETSQIVKSLIIESEGEKFHVLLPGDRTLSEKKFGAEYRMISPEEAEEITGFESGTVHPFSTELNHVADERIFENDRVSHTVGEKTRGVIIDAESFMDALQKSGFNLEVMDIAVSNEEDFGEIQKFGLDEESAKFVVNEGYRKNFLELVEEFDSSSVLDLLKAFNREGLYPGLEKAEEILERAEGQTHMQRLVEKLAENGQIPDQQDFHLGEKIEEIIEENPGAVEDYKEGRESAVNYFIGQIMQETNGKADAGEARKILIRELEK